MPTRGTYWVVQYIPDPGRAEAANVGVVIHHEPSGEVHWRMIDADSKQWARLAKYFGEQMPCYVMESIEMFSTNLKRAASAEDKARRAKDIEQWFGTLGNAIRATPGRHCSLRDDISLDDQADDYFGRLVESPLVADQQT